MRTTSRRARRLGGLLLLAATVWWAFMRRRANAVRWVEPPATTLPTGGAPTGAAPAEPGAPGELPDDVVATDAGLTELPDVAVDEAPAGTVDEARVAEILAESADADVVVVDETSYERAVADAAPEPAAPEPAAAEPAAAEPAAAEPAAPEQAAPEPAAPEPAAAAEEGPAGEADVESEVVATGPAGAEPSAGTSEAGLEAAVPSAAGEESTEAGLDAGVPSGAAADEEPTERELAAPGVEESAVSIRPEVSEETARGIPMPTFSEAPTAEIPAVTDDLRAVRGIGPSMERKLRELGIVSYRQLAMLDGAELERVRADLTDFRGRIEREDWVGQARALYREKYGRDPA